MIQHRNAVKEIKRRAKRAGENIGSLNFLTLLAPSGNKNMVIFLEVKFCSPQNVYIRKRVNRHKISASIAIIV